MRTCAGFGLVPLGGVLAYGFVGAFLLPLVLHPLDRVRAEAARGIPCQDEDAKRKATELLDAVAATMKDAPAIAFEVTEGWRECSVRAENPFDIRKKKYVLKRPNLVRFEYTEGAKGFQVLDGKTAWWFDREKNQYSRTPQPENLRVWFLFEPLIMLYFEKGSRDLVKGCSSLRLAHLKDKELDIVEWSGGNFTCRLTLDSQKVVLTFRTVFYHAGAGTPQYESVVEFSNLNLAPKLADDLFTFTPPKNGTESRGDSRPVGTPLKEGAEAPDFEATDVEGNSVRLSDFKGCPVLLVFWIHGRGPCQDQLPSVEKLQAEYRNRGVAVLAVNSGDAPDWIKKRFEKEKRTLRPLFQKGDEIDKAFGVSVYPTCYVITADRKVETRTLGFEEEKLRAALDKLAPKK